MRRGLVVLLSRLVVRETCMLFNKSKCLAADLR